MRGDPRPSVKGKKRRGDEGRSTANFRETKSQIPQRALNHALPRPVTFHSVHHCLGTSTDKADGWAPAGAGFRRKNKCSAVCKKKRKKKPIKGFTQ